MGKVILSGYIDIPENELEVVTTALEKHIELTRNEAGCLIFEVTQSSELSTRFTVYEEFTDKAAFESHLARVKASEWGRVTGNVKPHVQYRGTERITNNLKVIQHAWHFWFGLSSVFTVVKLSVVVAYFTPK
tara:strand:- start:610 stop:1005 length:396 start_codon:yes stop_codon:yes gene_type:complete